MDWINYGSYWHIDHIIPCTLYDLFLESEQKKCFNYRNLRPLEIKENFRKSNKFDLNLIKQYNIEDLLPEDLKKCA
jgi:hypothetical protein